MRRSALIGWIPPAIITVAIAVYAGGVMTGRWDPNPTRADAGVVPKVDSTDPEMRKSQELCPFVDRRELLDLLEPGAKVKGIGTTYDPGGDSHQCTVSLQYASLRLNVAHDRLRVADYQGLFEQAQPRTVLGRPALWLLDPVPIVNIPLKSASLLVAWDPTDPGGTASIAIIRESHDPGDEARATQIAERILPTLPGWPG
ncbi:hypothetical protein AB0J72_42760 [Dactylosporangium sp. NPDC049742]|uniref:hypothetical protein n=1 Tax=Dactylosporangium sp. NPDC049742 TaxID=3154737 RepID=UPI0034139099